MNEPVHTDHDPEVVPFRGNLEYLCAILSYLQTLAARRLATRRWQARRLGLQAKRCIRSRITGQLFTRSRDGLEEVDESTSLEELEADRLQIGREAEMQHAELEDRIRVTLQTTQVDLPLERLAGEYGLDEFEKLVLVTLIGPSLDNDFRCQAPDSLTGLFPC